MFGVLRTHVALVFPTDLIIVMENIVFFDEYDSTIKNGTVYNDNCKDGGYDVCIDHYIGTIHVTPKYIIPSKYLPLSNKTKEKLSNYLKNTNCFKSVEDILKTKFESLQYKTFFPKLYELMEKKTETEYNIFVEWYENIVLGEMGVSPSEEALIGMWSLHKHYNKSVQDEITASLLPFVVKEFLGDPRIKGYSKEELQNAFNKGLNSRNFI